MSEKIYIGKGKPGKFGTKINICISDIPEDAFSTLNGKKYFRADVLPRKDPDDKGNTHYIVLDTWKPEAKPIEPRNDFIEPSSDLPF